MYLPCLKLKYDRMFVCIYVCMYVCLYVCADLLTVLMCFFVNIRQLAVLSRDPRVRSLPLLFAFKTGTVALTWLFFSYLAVHLHLLTHSWIETHTWILERVNLFRERNGSFVKCFKNTMKSCLGGRGKKRMIGCVSATASALLKSCTREMILGDVQWRKGWKEKNVFATTAARWETGTVDTFCRLDLCHSRELAVIFPSPPKKYAP